MATATATAKSKPKPAAKAKAKADASSVSLHGLQPYKESKKEEYMNENQREHFKLILKAWRRELMEEVDRTVSHMKDEAANFPDPADRATQEEEFMKVHACPRRGDVAGRAPIPRVCLRSRCR